MSLEVKIMPMALPEVPKFNYMELKEGIEKIKNTYTTLVYSEENIKEAKKDKADLNKLKNALNEGRKKMEKEYMIPFNECKKQIDDLINSISEPIEQIDLQIKEAENYAKEEKKTKLQEVIVLAEQELSDGIKIPFDSKWLNVSLSLKKAKEEILQKKEEIKNNLDILNNLDDFSFEAIEIYKSTLDMKEAMAEVKHLKEMALKKARMEEEKRQREELKAIKSQQAMSNVQPMSQMPMPNVQPMPQMPMPNVRPMPQMTPAWNSQPQVTPIVTGAEPRQWFSLSVHVTMEEVDEIKKFFQKKNISYKAC